MAYGSRDRQRKSGIADVDAERRLQALDAYEILDTEAEGDFDDLAFLAKQLCNAPVALISLIEEDRQWFKSSIGFDACETPIEQSVCRHGLRSTDLLVIPDLTADDRTRDNPLVLNDPSIRFYAGAPLITPEGTNIGMLCVIDVEVRPNGLSADQARSLKTLAAQVVNQLEVRKALRTRDRELARERSETEMLRRAKERLEFAEEAGHVGAFEADFKQQEIQVSREFCRIHGLEPKSTISFSKISQDVEGADVIIAELMADASFTDGEFRIRRAGDGAWRWIDIRGRSRIGADGKPEKMTGVVYDVTDRRAVNEEISHRLKNTLALVQAIAGHTLRNAVDPEVAQEFNRRIGALATAHDVLLGHARKAACLGDLISGVLTHLSIEERVDRAIPDFALSSQSVLSLSMLIHELGTNAMKYGALSTESGRVALIGTIEPREDGDWLVVDWREEGGPPASTPEKRGLGTRLIERGISHDGETVLNFDPAGLHVRMAAPVAQIAA